MRVCVATDRELPTFVPTLQSRHDVECVPISGALNDPRAIEVLIVSADLRDGDGVRDIRKLIAAAPNSRKRLFVLDRKSHLTIVQAFALGATRVLAEPVNMNELMQAIEEQACYDEEASRGDPSAQSVIDAAAPFGSLFMAVAREATVLLADAEDTTDLIHDAVVRHGLTHWIRSVRQHHRGTFQHCLLVTGCAIDFACTLGFSRRDVRRLGLMATLHDVGKARIPVAILDKPGQLDETEREIMESHPTLGWKVLKDVEGVSMEMLDGVRHHHEFLDGSGYPDRIGGAQISDLVRMLTIADIFAALIENRGYRPALPREDAYETLQQMAGKVERPLVKAFRRVALAN